ncbi:hypothetical protein JHK85_017778 [Glycine max]|nr:hypothetical protein JHK85_017778 [Glycine max]
MASANDLTETERSTAKSLRHVGRKLLKCSSVHKLLQLLDKLELLLSSLDQEPTKPIQESLVPAMKALISDELLRHTDGDVKISVTSCINEITRITAPDVPYDDEQMKEIFKLTVASFEKLSHISGRGYEKALTILDNANKVRLCLVMLDLECNDLVIEMFQHFLRYIRSDHPCNAIHSMEPIMTLILQEIEQISPALLRPLLDSVGNENQIISPMSWSLGEKVISNCAVNLKPYLMKAVESSGRALNEYAQILTDICQNQSESPQCDDSNGSKKTVEDNLNSLLEKTSLDSPAVRLEKESEVRKDSEIKPIRKIKFSVRVDGKLVAPESVAKREPSASCGYEGKHKSFVNIELENIEESRSSAQTDVKKRRRLNATPNKGVNKSSAVKELIVESASKTLGGVKETPQASLRRRHITANVEASESCDDGSSLVCRRIKVWWPKDKMFYEGVIDSYDPIKGKHKILYADGDVEVLNLKRQRWEPVTVDVLLHEEGLAHQRHAQASDIAENGKEKSALESAKGANINSQSSRGRASASAGIFKSVKSADTSAVDLADDSPIIFSRKDSRTPKTKRRRV